MDNTVTVAIVNGTFLVVGGVLAKQNRSIKKQAKENHKTATEASTKMDTVIHQTNGVLNDKIKAAVREVFTEKHGDIDAAIVVEALANLLEAMLDERKAS